MSELLIPLAMVVLAALTVWSASKAWGPRRGGKADASAARAAPPRPDVARPVVAPPSFPRRPALRLTAGLALVGLVALGQAAIMLHAATKEPARTRGWIVVGAWIGALAGCGFVSLRRPVA